jgi:hypothetical protein
MPYWGLQATRLLSPEPPDFAKQKRKNKMSKVFGAFLALALLVGASAAYAWDQQATD